MKWVESRCKIITSLTILVYWTGQVLGRYFCMTFKFCELKSFLSITREFVELVSLTSGVVNVLPQGALGGQAFLKDPVQFTRPFSPLRRREILDSARPPPPFGGSQRKKTVFYASPLSRLVSSFSVRYSASASFRFLRWWWERSSIFPSCVSTFCVHGVGLRTLNSFRKRILWPFLFLHLPPSSIWAKQWADHTFGKLSNTDKRTESSLTS